MEPLGDQIRAELSRVGADSGAAEDAVTAWPAAVGDEIARNAWPSRTAAGQAVTASSAAPLSAPTRLSSARI